MTIIQEHSIFHQKSRLLYSDPERLADHFAPATLYQDSPDLHRKNGEKGPSNRGFSGLPRTRNANNRINTSKSFKNSFDRSFKHRKHLKLNFLDSIA
jgi:hypothetical protein